MICSAYSIGLITRERMNLMSENLLFGEFLREKRKSLNLTQIALAEVIGINQSTLSFWETGLTSPPIEVARNYLDFLGADLKIVNRDNDEWLAQYFKRLQELGFDY